MQGSNEITAQPLLDFHQYQIQTFEHGVSMERGGQRDFVSVPQQKDSRLVELRFLRAKYTNKEFLKVHSS